MYDQHLNKSTDVASLAQVLAFVWYINERTIKEDMLFWVGGLGRVDSAGE